MSKKAKIKELQSRNTKLRVALKVSIARQVAAQEFAHKYKISEMARRMLIDDRRKFEHDLSMAKNKIERLVDDLNVSDSYTAYLEAQVDELQESLGECQAGREALQRQIDTDIWREQGKADGDMVLFCRQHEAGLKWR